MIDSRAIRAAGYWASRPGNFHCFHVFSYEDALQEANIGLILNPSATWAILYRRVLDAARRLIPGYRQRAVPTMVSFDDVAAGSTDCRAEHITLLNERAAILDALPEDKRMLVWHWVYGDTDAQAGARYGVNPAAWCKRRITFFKQLQQRGL